MPSDRVKATVKKKVLSRPLEDVRRAIEKTEQQDFGVTYDVLDNIEVSNYAMNGLKKVSNYAMNGLKTRATQATPRTVQISPTQATPRTVQLRPTQVPKKKIAEKVIQGGSKAVAAGKFLAKKAPPVTAAIMAYEAASLANSEEARDKAREQQRVMGERGSSMKGAVQNMAQGFLDPMGTLYGVGSAIGEIASIHSKIAAQKFARRHQRGIKR